MRSFRWKRIIYGRSIIMEPKELKKWSVPIILCKIFIPNLGWTMMLQYFYEIFDVSNASSSSVDMVKR